MTIEQFCDMLKEARKLSGVPWVDVCYRMRKTQSTIISMLDGKHDASMERIFNYIEAIEAEITISDKVFCHEPELHVWLTEECRKYPEKKICEIIHTTPMTVRRIRSGRTHYKVSYFLEILNYLQLPCQVLPIGIQVPK